MRKKCVNLRRFACVCLHFLKYLFIFREGKGRRERGRETSMCGCLSYAPPSRDLACNAGMCPD